MYPRPEESPPMFRHTLLGTAIATLFSVSATAADYNATWFFGDSLSDAGSFTSFLPPGTGRFTTNPGPVWAENLAAALGTAAVPAVAGGTDYAQGGARVTLQPGVPGSNALTAGALPVMSQITAYLDAHNGRADRGALYSVWAGANDLFVAIDPARPESADPLGYTLATAGQTAAGIAGLQAAGARYILVPTMPDIGATPFGFSIGVAGAAGLTALSDAYNQALFGGLAAAGVRVIPLDTFTLLREVGADPARYGFVNVTLPACGAAASLVCTAADFISPAADQTFLFADGVHPTTAGHRVIADYALGVLRAPGAMSLLAESPLYTREALLGTVQDQTAQAAPSGTGVWASAGGGRVKYSSSGPVPGAAGNPANVSVGIDTALMPGLVVGAAVAADSLDADFAADAGEFRQDEQTIALYAAWRAGPLHATVVGAASDIDYDTRRDVALGVARRTMKGSTSGSNLSLGVQAGYELSAGALRHGPVVGLHRQQVEIDGFREQGAGSTTMWFAGQDRDSLLGSVGYQLRLDSGRCTPWARIAFSHEFEGGKRNVGATLVALPANRFELPAFAPERTWGTAALGVAAKLTPTLGGSMALSTRFSQDNVRSYALQAGLRLAF